jgi:hypothetical protein
VLESGILPTCFLLLYVPLVCCLSCCPQVPERRNVVRSNRGFPDAIALIVGARLGFDCLGVEQEVRPPVISAIVLSLLRIRARG